MQQAIQNMSRLAGIGRDDLGVEGRIPIGDVSVELHARFRAIFGVIIGAGFAVSAGLEKLAIRAVFLRVATSDPLRRHPAHPRKEDLPGVRWWGLCITSRRLRWTGGLHEEDGPSPLVTAAG
jgi:hypothetical protein